VNLDGGGKWPKERGNKDAMSRKDANGGETPQLLILVRANIFFRKGEET